MNPFLRILLMFVVAIMSGATSMAQQTSNWNNASGGLWTNGTNWDTGDAPGTGDIANIDLVTGAFYVVTLEDEESVEIDRVVIDSEDARLLVYGMLDLPDAGSIDVQSGVLVMWGGRVQGGSINQTGGRIVLNGLQRDSEFGSTTINGDLSFVGTFSSATLIDSHINGGLDMDNGGQVRMYNSNQTFSDTNIQFHEVGRMFLYRDENQSGFSNGSSLTFEESANVSGGVYIQIDESADGATFTNRTMLLADGDDISAEMLIQADSADALITNEGQIVGTNGAVLEINKDAASGDNRHFHNAENGTITLDGSFATIGAGASVGSNSWRNDGLIEVVNGSRLTLGGDFTLDDMGEINRTNDSEIVITGDLDNRSQEWELNESTGDFTLDRGRIFGGTIRLDGGSLRFEKDGEGTRGALSATVVEGTIELVQGSRLTVWNGTSIDRIVLTGSDAEVRYNGSTNRLRAGQSIDLGASGIITQSFLSIFEESSEIKGSGEIRTTFNSGSIVNRGLIEVGNNLTIDLDDGEFSTAPSVFTNEGEIVVPQGTQLNLGRAPFDGQLSGDFVNEVSGLISVEGRMDVFEPWQNTGTISIGSAGEVNITPVDGAAVEILGTTRMSGGTLTVLENVQAIFGGELTGFGTIDADVRLAGDFLVGDESETGLFEITGALELDSAATIQFEIGGSSLGQNAEGYDSLNVGSDLTLGGELMVGVFDEVIVGELDHFIITEFQGTLSGEFENVVNGGFLSSTDGLYRFRVNYGSDSAFDTDQIVLSNFVAVPEPNAGVVLLFAIFANGLSRRRAS